MEIMLEFSKNIMRSINHIGWTEEFLWNNTFKPALICESSGRKPCKSLIDPVNLESNLILHSHSNKSGDTYLIVAPDRDIDTRQKTKTT